MSSLNPVVKLSEKTESFNEFIKRHKIDWDGVNFKQYQYLFLKLIEDYLHQWDVNDEELKEILQTLISEKTEIDSREITKLKNLIFYLQKYSDDVGSKWFRAFLADSEKYFDDHTHLFY